MWNTATPWNPSSTCANMLTKAVTWQCYGFQIKTMTSLSFRWVVALAVMKLFGEFLVLVFTNDNQLFNI